MRSRVQDLASVSIGFAVLRIDSSQNGVPSALRNAKKHQVLSEQRLGILYLPFADIHLVVHRCSSFRR